MSVEAVRWALRQKLEAPAKPVLVVLAWHAVMVDAYPKILTIMFETGFSKRSVYRALAELEEKKLITRDGRRESKTGFGSTNWRLNVNVNILPETDAEDDGNVIPLRRSVPGGH